VWATRRKVAVPVPDTATWEQFLQQVRVLQICAPCSSIAKLRAG